MSDINIADIKLAVSLSGLPGFTGEFEALGGGEVNDTFALDCGTNKAILRFARDHDQQTLQDEATALRLVDIPGQVPTLIFFDEQQRIKDRLWILESYIEGTTVDRLNAEQFKSLGALLANVHGSTQSTKIGVGLWECFLLACSAFGNEQKLLEHPNSQLKVIIHRARNYFQAQQHMFAHVVQSVVHGDATPSNTLVSGDRVALIDWEFSRFNDPMAEFSTIYYDDMEYNRGRWRPHIQDFERQAIFEGYRSSGGTIDEERLKVWMNLDKLGASVFLYWRINETTREANNEALAQYQLDLDNLLSSLEVNLRD